MSKRSDVAIARDERDIERKAQFKSALRVVAAARKVCDHIWNDMDQVFQDLSTAVEEDRQVNK